jgi:hypothetical protein
MTFLNRVREDGVRFGWQAQSSLHEVTQDLCPSWTAAVAFQPYSGPNLAPHIERKPDLCEVGSNSVKDWRQIVWYRREPHALQIPENLVRPESPHDQTKVQSVPRQHGADKPHAGR